MVTKFLLCIFKALLLSHKTRKMGFLSINKQQFSNLIDNHQKVTLLQSYFTLEFSHWTPRGIDVEENVCWVWCRGF